MSTPGSDFERFRQTLDQEHEQLLEASRSSRFRPPTDLATARLTLLGDATDAEPVVAEILDLNGDGMKIAITPGPSVRVGQLCLLRFEPRAGLGFQLKGEVRWVQTNTFIQVFGILLLAADAEDNGD